MSYFKNIYENQAIYVTENYNSYDKKLIKMWTIWTVIMHNDWKIILRVCAMFQS
jgi:hypothetical protein